MPTTNKHGPNSKNHNKSIKPTNKTKTRLLNNGKIIIEGTRLDLGNYLTDIEDSEAQLVFSENMKIKRNRQIQFGSFKREEKWL